MVGLLATVSLLMPPIAFAILLAAGFVFAWLMSLLAPRGHKTRLSGRDPYACGEEIRSHLMQPDYGQFLPFAFFFTVLHVMALMAATVPAATAGSLAIAAAYLGCAGLGVYVLYSR